MTIAMTLKIMVITISMTMIMILLSSNICGRSRFFLTDHVIEYAPAKTEDVTQVIFPNFKLSVYYEKRVRFKFNSSDFL